MSWDLPQEATGQNITVTGYSLNVTSNQKTHSLMNTTERQTVVTSTQGMNFTGTVWIQIIVHYSNLLFDNMMTEPIILTVPDEDHSELCVKYY